MTLLEIKDKLEDILNEMDVICDDESLTSFPRAFKNLTNKVGDLADKVESALQDEENKKESVE